MSYGSNLFFGFLPGKVNGDYYERDNTYIILNPYFSRDYKNIGIKLGLSLGYFQIDGIYRQNPDKSGQYDHGLVTLFFFPQVAMRLGPVEKLYLDVRLDDKSVSGSNLTMLQAGVGSGLGRTDGTFFRAGMSFNFQPVDSLNGIPWKRLYVQTKIPIVKTFFLEGFLSTNFEKNLEAKYSYGFGISYRFNYKLKDRKNYVDQGIQ
jgi:hypothetical protein